MCVPVCLHVHACTYASQVPTLGMLFLAESHLQTINFVNLKVTMMMVYTTKCFRTGHHRSNRSDLYATLSPDPVGGGDKYRL